MRLSLVPSPTGLREGRVISDIRDGARTGGRERRGRILIRAHSMLNLDGFILLYIYIIDLPYPHETNHTLPPTSSHIVSLYRGGSIQQKLLIWHNLHVHVYNVFYKFCDLIL